MKQHEHLAVKKKYLTACFLLCMIDKALSFRRMGAP